MNDSPARIDPDEAAIGRPTQTARRLVEASVSPNTRRAYTGALWRLDAWLAGRELDDAALATYLAELHDAGRASSSATMAVAAACFRAKLAGQPTPAGERTARVLAGYRRTAGDRGRGQARPFGVSDLAAVLAAALPHNIQGRVSRAASLNPAERPREQRSENSPSTKTARISRFGIVRYGHGTRANSADTFAQQKQRKRTLPVSHDRIRSHWDARRTSSPAAAKCQ